MMRTGGPLADYPRQFPNPHDCPFCICGNADSAGRVNRDAEFYPLVELVDRYGYERSRRDVMWPVHDG